MGRGGCGGMRQGQRGRDTGGRGCGGREQRDSKVTRVGAACVGVGATQGWGRTRVGAPGPVVEPAVAHKVRKRHAAVEARRKRTTRAAGTSMCVPPGTPYGTLPSSTLKTLIVQNIIIFA